MIRLNTRVGGRSMVPVELPCQHLTGFPPRHEQLVNLGLYGLGNLDANGNAPIKIVRCHTCGRKSRLTYERHGNQYWLVGEVIEK